MVRRLYGVDGAPLRAQREIGGTVEAHWQPVFEALHVDLVAQSIFLEHVVVGHTLSERSWARGSWRGGLQGVPDSARGPDGLCCGFWANSPPAWTSMVDGLAEALCAGAEPTSWPLDSVTSSIPKGDASTSTDNFNMTASELRPITLMQTLSKVLAYEANRALATIAESSVAAPQRGFVRNPSIADNVLEFEGKWYELSQGVQDSAELLLDFQTAFPSIGHDWLWAVFRCIVWYALCIVSCPQLSFAGEVAGRIPLASGITQRCPLSCTLFALGLDPLLRRYMSSITMASSRICAFADDLALVLPSATSSRRSSRCSASGPSRRGSD